MLFVVQHSDEDIRSMSAEEIVKDCLPGNYIATAEQAEEIASEIVRALRIEFSG